MLVLVAIAEETRGSSGRACATEATARAKRVTKKRIRNPYNETRKEWKARIEQFECDAAGRVDPRAGLRSGC